MGSSLYRENRENSKDICQENTENFEIWPKHREFWYSKIVNFMILKIKDVLLFAITFSFFVCVNSCTK